MITASPTLSPQMRVHVPLSMASLPELVSVVQSKVVEWSVVSSSTSWMQFISWCFVSVPRVPPPTPSGFSLLLSTTLFQV